MRTLTEWAEAEIVLPNGPFAGERYRHDRHPVSRPWCQAIDSGLWTRFAATGPQQNGKTLICYVLPVLHHVFEVGETVIVGLPDMAMAQDKWREDFLPVIEASRYRELLPLRGEGSRGGQVKQAIRFRNGATLRFMSGGGGDKKRAGYTARVVAVTEVDGMDEPGAHSREADKIEQLEGRTRAFGRTGKRVYLECTASIEKGRIWQEIKNGTNSRLARPCPHCRAWVTPEREHLKGWQDAQSETEAADGSRWHCPACDQSWTEDQRHESARRAVLIHRGQSITKRGKITGDFPSTQTLGFRWSAIDNPFSSAADVGVEEWIASKSRDRENAEKKLRQFVYALPYEPPEIDLTPLDPADVELRKGGLKRGQVPSDCVGIAVGVDTGKRHLHWDAIAVTASGNLQSLDYGCQAVESDRLGVRNGLLAALQTLRGYLDSGWTGIDGRHWQPSQVWIDSGYHEHTEAVYHFCRVASQGLAEGTDRYRPAKGFGEGQLRMGRYIVPSRRTGDILYVGNQYDVRRVRRAGQLLHGVHLVHINVDHWKSSVHQRLAMPPEEPGALVLFEDPAGHAEWAMQVTAERQIEKFIPGRGRMVVWQRVDRQNHHLDSVCYAMAAGDFVAARSVSASSQSPRKSWWGDKKGKRGQ